MDFLKRFSNLIELFLTSKKFFIVRLFFISGFLIILYDEWINQTKFDYSGANIVLFPLIAFLAGAIFISFSISLSDIFCKEKFFDNVEKYNNNDYNRFDIINFLELARNNKNINDDYKKIQDDEYTLIRSILISHPMYRDIDENSFCSYIDKEYWKNERIEENKATRLNFLNNIALIIENLKMQTENEKGQ